MPDSPHNLNRRDFLAAAAGTTVAGGWVRRVLAGTGQDAGTANPNGEAVRFGVIADPHHGLQPDAQSRLDAFISDCLKRDDLDFIIQLGDFCHPLDEAAPFVASFNRFPRSRYHVLGNHDMDHGSKSDVLKCWAAERRYHSFDAGPFHFVVLDCNNLRDGDTYTHYDDSNFYIQSGKRGWTDPEQRDWLAADLASTRRPTIVFSHQPIGIFSPDRDTPPPQQRQVLEILSTVDEDAGMANIIATMSGHLHVDRVERHRGFHCVSINSASYHWAGGRHPYRDSLYAFVTCFENGTIVIDGCVSEFADGHPNEKGFRIGVPGVRASISDRSLPAL